MIERRQEVPAPERGNLMRAKKADVMIEFDSKQIPPKSRDREWADAGKQVVDSIEVELTCVFHDVPRFSVLISIEKSWLGAREKAWETLRISAVRGPESTDVY